MAQISPDDLESYRKAFKLVDKDNSGSIDFDELKECFEKCNIEFTSESLEKMIKSADDDGNGVIDFEEFCQLIVKLYFQKQKYKSKNK